MTSPAITAGWRISRLILLCAFLFHSLHPAAQEAPETNYVDVAAIRTTGSLENIARYTMADPGAISDRDIAGLDISQKIPLDLLHKLNPREIEKIYYLKFFLENRSDTPVSFYFFPGMFCRNIRLFKGPPGEGLAPVENSLRDRKPLTGYVADRLMPQEKAVYVAKLQFIFASQNKLSPVIIRNDFISFFRMSLLNHKTSLHIFNYVTAGILLMMIIYAISAYLQDYQIEFVYYASYALSMATLLFLKSFLYASTSTFNYYFEGCFDFLIQMTGYSFYLLFIRKFLSTQIQHPWLDKVLKLGNIIILLAITVFSLMYFVVSDYQLTSLAENITKLFLLGLSIVFILYGLWKNDPLMNYIVAGQTLLVLFSILSFVLIISSFRFTHTPNELVNDPLLYFQAGVVFELIFFMSGLTYKNKRILIERVRERERLKLENERKEFEKQVAILEAKQQERNRISADMHDELGSGVTAIRLMSEIVKAKMKDSTLPEIEKISSSANDLLSKMNTIIWTMVSSNDTVESLLAYIRAYAVEFFDNTGIDCRFEYPIYLPNLDLSGEKRRNIFLAVKEALNNIVKHSKAGVVTIRAALDEKLFIEIFDNGVGINLEQLRKFGNGLQNMKRRIESIGGSFHIRNQQGTGLIFEIAMG